MGLALFWTFAVSAQAELRFPILTGPVVDSAQMIAPSVREHLTQQLQAHEAATGEQLVVVILPDLQGLDIADFGYRLGRHWGIGQKDKNNGALLIVARDERKLRIEVGYGIEDRLTDAQSSLIINQVITPELKTGNFSKGISDGVAAMLVVLGDNSTNELVSNHGADKEQDHDFVEGSPWPFVFFGIFFVLACAICQLLGIGSSGSSRGRSGSSGSSGSSNGDSGSSGGGGGSFGGGGSSGSW
jgi:uncharacterized protein